MSVSVKKAFLDEYDSIAAKRKAAAAAIVAGRDAWDIANATDEGDFEAFQNRVCVTALSTMDALNLKGIPGKSFKTLLDKLSDYIRLDLALAGPNYRQTYLQAIGARCPYEAAEAILECYDGARNILPQWVYPKGTLATTGSLAALGLHKFGALTGTSGASTWAETDGALDSARIIGAPIICQTIGATPAGTPLMSCVMQDGETLKAITVTPSATNNAQVVVGEQAVTGVTNAHKVTVAATGQFAEGEWVLIWENADGATAIREPAQIKTLVENTSLEFESDLVNTISAAAVVLPMFLDISWTSGNIAENKVLDFYAKPDRIIVP